MSLVTTIKNLQKESRIAHNKEETSLYTTLLGEVLAVGKNAGNRETTDQECIAIIKKFIKNLSEFNRALIEHEGCTEQETYQKNCREIYLLDDLLPIQLGEIDLKAILKAFPDYTLSDFMRNLKTNWSGQYDGALASKVFKDFNKE